MLEIVSNDINYYLYSEDVEIIEKLGSTVLEDLTNQRVGKLLCLVPIYRKDLKRKDNYKGNIYWICLCDCGNYTIISNYRLHKRQTLQCIACADGMVYNNKTFVPTNKNSWLSDEEIALKLWLQNKDDLQPYYEQEDFEQEVATLLHYNRINNRPRTASMGHLLEYLKKKNINFNSDKLVTLEEGLIDYDLEELLDNIDNTIYNFNAEEIIIKCLSSREADILLSRLSIGREQQTLDEIGKKYNITRERVRQIEFKCLKKLVRHVRKYTDMQP